MNAQWKMQAMKLSMRRVKMKILSLLLTWHTERNATAFQSCLKIRSLEKRAFHRRIANRGGVDGQWKCSEYKNVCKQKHLILYGEEMGFLMIADDIYSSTMATCLIIIIIILKLYDEMSSDYANILFDDYFRKKSMSSSFKFNQRPFILSHIDYVRGILIRLLVTCR